MRFCWDSKGSFLGNTAYFGALPKWSGAILNSTLIEFILRQLTNSIHGGFVRLFTENVQHLPMVTPSKIIQKRLDSLIDQVTKANPASSANLEIEINDIVYEIYGVNPDDRKVIQAWFDRRNLLMVESEDISDEFSEAE
jgi:uncharacterized protein YggL (DUF469 family)